MKVETSAAFLALLSVAAARPDAIKLFRKGRQVVGASAKFRREVPQEHSHEKFLTGVGAALNLNNVDQVSDPVFALLGNAAAAQGAGQVTDLDCLQQRVADQAFTNAKAANDVEGMTNALIFRALERNTGAVGQASVLCTSETAKNPEIAALQQHQDPASDGAAALNKQITLDLAVQLASIGADPQLALQSGTFAPGEIGDATGAGNTCDEADDPEGCIFTQNLLVEDATADEIDAAVAAGGGNANAGGNANNNNNNANAGNANNAADDAEEDDEDGADDAANDAANSNNNNNSNNNANAGNASNSTGNASNNNNNNNNAGNANNNANAGATPTASGNNVNTFTGSVGAPPVPVISSNAAKPFSVNGAEFLNIGAAIQRACDVQKNQCANAANSGADASISVSDCDAQQKQCAAQNTAAKKLRLRAADTGSCGSPAISFGTQKDRASEQAFAPVNTADFNHGSALKPAVITDFICSQLASKCKADAATVSQCEEGAEAANSLQGQAAADAFNAALGV
ncbi:uncharacterized protein GGS25DRAFT_517551 [Hypoxylon fragiforme]|uniref:uncharacterized protein n=1 Tax=Hypoxylon fragiforme TaxID=63214 RepID=UPI0020C6CED7|nr:uncharacterized protein GGS25DRAFT_517551 [Hypoxylon fragiforme]KAI2614704.1 hypothetical protein GGS25DRAFT_517551 [Hypoxylon fragiforme]